VLLAVDDWLAGIAADVTILNKRRPSGRRFFFFRSHEFVDDG
jgi:hypothetical protein